MSELEERISTRTASVGLVGLGYVGLPLAVAFSEAGFKVLGFDIQRQRVDLINKCRSHVEGISGDRLAPLVAKGTLEATADMRRVADMDAICICVPPH